MRANLKVLALLFFALFSGPAAADAAEIEIVVERDHITAGDLAKVLPAWKKIDAATEIAYAPLPGIDRRVEPRLLLRWARQFSIDLETAPPPALLVSRRMRALTEAQAAEHLRDALSTQFEVNPEQVRVSLHQFREPLVPATSLSFDAGSAPGVFNRPATVSLRWRDGDGHTGSAPLRATVEVLGSHALAREALAARSEINPEDFDFRHGSLPGPPSKFLLTPDDVAGKELKYPLKPGDLLQAWMLAARTTVRRGDLIQLRLQAGGIVLEVPARAEQAGSVGDRITCRNLDSGRRVTATVLEAKLAEVVLEP